MGINRDILIPSFGRHETFHPRYGWLKKAYDRIVEDPRAFRADNRTVRFGVGKNMVNAIKFWSLAFKITEERKDGLGVTETGSMIFGSDGLDPYLERSETLWLLHWLLFAPPCRIPTWWMIMNRIPGTVVLTERIYDAAQECVRNFPNWDPPSPASVKRDVDVFLHTYTSRRDKLTIEEYIDCPFRNMRLARHNGGTVRFTYGPKPGLSPEVVAFACTDFVNMTGSSRDASVARMSVESGGPGNIFKMNENDLVAALESASIQTGLVSLIQINGVPHLRFPNGIKKASSELLRHIYKNRTKMQCIQAETVP